MKNFLFIKKSWKKCHISTKTLSSTTVAKTDIYYIIYIAITWINCIFTFTFMHLADAFIQSDLQCIQAVHVLSVCVFPGNWTHNLLRC